MHCRIETGELLHIPRLEKGIFCLQKRLKLAINGRERLLCEFRFSVHINHYAKLTVSTILKQDDMIGGEYPITGSSYTIELCETDHILALHETTAEPCEPLTIVIALLQKMDKYDVKHLFMCYHCMDNLVEKGKQCCDPCDISKITYFDMCSICQDDDYLTVASVWCKLECSHIFHKHCILQIKCHAGERFKCPLCRHDQSLSAVEVI
jgi:hypothetical protein